MSREFNYSKVTTVTVIPREPDVDVDVEFDEPNTIYQGSIIDALVKVKNREDEELIRDITVRFPLQKEFDIIGPKNFFIDRLEPDESVEIRNVYQIRPKVFDNNKNLEFGEVSVEYYDAYGTRFFENSTVKSFDVKKSRISGPALFLFTVVPPLANISSDFKVRIEARNLGNELAEGMVFLGDNEWEISVPPAGLKVIEYNLKYDIPGNYTVPAPTATIKYHGKEMHIGSSEKNVEVRLLQPETAIPEAEVEAIPEVEAAPVENPTIDEIEQALIEQTSLEAKEEEAKNTNLTIYLIIGAVALFAIAIYVFYERGKKKSAVPFLE
jgi:hypothetical protein